MCAMGVAKSIAHRVRSYISPPCFWNAAAYPSSTRCRDSGFAKAIAAGVPAFLQERTLCAMGAAKSIAHKVRSYMSSPCFWNAAAYPSSTRFMRC